MGKLRERRRVAVPVIAALGGMVAPAVIDYAAQIVANAKRLAQVLAERGFDLVSGGTDNHLLLIDLTSKGVEGKPAAQGLDRAGLVPNYNTVPPIRAGRSTPPASGWARPG